ncbi:hypothetical protein [Polaromonas hydrogenivorans]|uniref:Uncharacterized protein n=1 Tax=Polaromonas hydrogenivorans TaxID=335476 RepID=A0AAU7LY51_9BURK
MEKPQAQAFLALAAIAARIASEDVFVCGFTIPNRSMSASKLNRHGCETIVHE